MGLLALSLACSHCHFMSSIVFSGLSSCHARWSLGGVGCRWCLSCWVICPCIRCVVLSVGVRCVVCLSIRPSLHLLCRVIWGFVVWCHLVMLFPVLVIWTHWHSSTLVTWHLHPVFHGCQWLGQGTYLRTLLPIRCHRRQQWLVVRDSGGGHHPCTVNSGHW